MGFQQVLINAQLSKVDVDVLIRQNIEKANKKRVKKGLTPLDTNITMQSIKKQAEKDELQAKAREVVLEKQLDKQKQSHDYYFKDEPNPDSLFAKANMVKKYNEKNEK